VALLAAALVVHSASAESSHRFSATYTGHGAGQIDGARASGTATATGHGNLMGATSLNGSAHGSFTSPTCVTFSGKATLASPRGSIILTARDARACVGDPGAPTASFSGHAKVTRGTATFAGARGTLAFKGTYSQADDSVTISFTGRITY
jgi:hypothetical protein